MKSAAAIAFDYRPSRWVAAAIASVTLLALAAIAVSGIPLALKIALASAASAYAAWSLRGFLRVNTRRIAWQQGGHWRIADIDGSEHVAELESGIVRGGWIVLRLRRADGRRIAIVLGPDNSDTDVRRRLRVQLTRVHDAQKTRPTCREPGPKTRPCPVAPLECSLRIDIPR
jgi:toxin CptA